MVSRYVHLENIKRFERLLQTETSPQKRAVLRRMLAEERAKDDETLNPPEPPEPPGDEDSLNRSAGGGS